MTVWADQRAGEVVSRDFGPAPQFKWCGREDSNFHVLSDTTTSTLRVYQFRHDRTFGKVRWKSQRLAGGRL